jgi:hypothetical protein
MRNLRYFHFHTVVNGRTMTCKVLGWSITDAVNTLRGMLYDGETIVGWE